MLKAATKRQGRIGRAESSHHTRSEPNLLEDSLAYNIRRAQVRCDTALVHCLGNKISPARLAALSTVGTNPGISQSELGALLNIAGPSVVKVVDDLENLGLLARGPSNDRRARSLRLTESGQRDLRRYADAIKRFEQKIAIRLTKSERFQLMQLLKRVATED